MLILCACSQASPSADPTTSLPPSELPSSTTDALGSAATEPTGVPGLTAADPLCAAWAGYVGTVQALAVAAAFGTLNGEQLASLELTSAPYLVEAAATIEQSWPAELEPDRASVIENRIGPYARRAGRAVDALEGAGMTTAALSDLKAAWKSALATSDPRSPVIVVPPVSGQVQAQLDAAATAYANAATPFAQDPGLVVDSVDASLTDAYVGARCPDLATSGVGDAL